MPNSCLILGSGMGGLALGALLARAGTEVTILEAHPNLIGGQAHTLEIDGYRFAAGPRYLWNFGPNQIGERFLRKCELAEQVPMVELDRTGFDHVYVGDEMPVHVPNGWTEYQALLQERFPGESKQIHQFFSLCRQSFRVVELLDELGMFQESLARSVWACIRRRPRATVWTLLRPYLTLHQVFEQCRLSPMLRAVLYGHGGVFALPAHQVSFHVYAGVTLLYHRGCYYPSNDMEGFTNALVNTITERSGSVLTNQRVISVSTSSHGIEKVTTQTGDDFGADAVVVNFDPRTFLSMMDTSQGKLRRRLPRYKHSRSVSSLFLGVDDVSVSKPHFGRHNVWYLADTDPMPGLYESDPRQPPRMLYVNSPTLVKGMNNDSPPGGATVTAFAGCDYELLKRASPTQRDALKEEHQEHILDVLEARFIPKLREHLTVKHLRDPVDKEQVWSAPFGNVYARASEPREIWKRIPYQGMLPNLYFVGAYVSNAGIASVIHGACRLYEVLTGDRT